MGTDAKSLLRTLYGCEDTCLDKSEQENEGRFWAEARRQGNQMLRKFGPPARWMAFRAVPLLFRKRLGMWRCVSFYGDARPLFLAVLDCEKSLPSIRTLTYTEGPHTWFDKPDLFVFRLVTPNEFVHALYVAHEPPGPLSREPDTDIWDELYADPASRGLITQHLIHDLRFELGQSPSDRALWDLAVDGAFTAPRAQPELSSHERRNEQEMFVVALEQAKAPLCERLAVERSNKLYRLGYRYDIRGHRRRLSWRLGRNGRDALCNAANRVIRLGGWEDDD